MKPYWQWTGLPARKLLLTGTLLLWPSPEVMASPASFVQAIPAPLAAESLATADPAMARLLADYFLLMHTQDLQLYDQVFHPRSHLYGFMQGQLNERSAADYRAQLAERASPRTQGFERAEQVLWVDYLSDDLALVKVRLSLYGNTMVDYLNLVKTDGEWRIISKLWARANDEPG